MSKTLKFFITAIAVVLTLGLVVSYVNHVVLSTYLTNYPLNGILAGLFLGLTVYYVAVFLKKLWTVLVLGLLFTVGSCQHAKSNQQVLISQDCGISWNEVQAGNAVPTKGVNTCFMKVIIPNYPMQGNSKFVAKIGGVKVDTETDYDYTITNPLAFIKQAKYLGHVNSGTDDGSLNPNDFEGAENSVIDLRIKEVVKALFLQEDIIELDQDELEIKLKEALNKMLVERGITINFITLNFIPDVQTRQAIDVVTAMKIYKANSIEQLGAQVITSKAGSNQINVNTTNQAPTEATKEN